MPRLPRTVFAGLPHHVTQRGNRRESIFFSDDDRLAYLSWLKEYADKHQVEVLAYCLMSNHIHLIAVPATDDGLQRMLKPLHMRYAQRVNLHQEPDSVLKPDSNWGKRFATIDNWSAWLQMADDVAKLDLLRQNANKGLPCGAADFVQSLGIQAGRPLEGRPQGRPSKNKG